MASTNTCPEGARLHAVNARTKALSGLLLAPCPRAAVLGHLRAASLNQTLVPEVSQGAELRSGFFVDGGGLGAVGSCAAGAAGGGLLLAKPEESA